MSDTSRSRLRHRFRAESTLQCVLGDFAAVGLPREPVTSWIEVGEHGSLTAHVDVGGRVLRVCAEQPQRLAAAVASFLQEGELLRGSEWPSIPGLGVLRPLVQGETAVWALSDGATLCEIGELFSPAP
ncbi:hypothetical protein [uncultured Microbacterium sp.]|uniref:hypothetical protein n=1 Tax=uncultured Microbacterium sp. TaxID=191216 RepID=UPI0028D3785D|nr:hypothetical protein [uncultured Microbacterium sp.]